MMNFEKLVSAKLFNWKNNNPHAHCCSAKVTKSVAKYIIFTADWFYRKVGDSPMVSFVGNFLFHSYLTQILFNKINKYKVIGNT